MANRMARFQNKAIFILYIWFVEYDKEHLDFFSSKQINGNLSQFNDFMLISITSYGGKVMMGPQMSLLKGHCSIYWGKFLIVDNRLTC